MRSSTLILTAGLSVFAIYKMPVVAAPADAPAQLKFVAMGIQNARQSAGCVRVSVNYSEKIPKQWLTLDSAMDGANKIAENDGQKTITGRWARRGSEMSMTVNGDEADHQSNLSQVRLVSKSRQIKYLQKYLRGANAKKAEYEGVVAVPEVVLSHSVWRGYAHMDPRTYAYFPYMGGQPTAPLDEMLLDRKLAPTFEGEEVVENSNCAKVKLFPQKRSMLVFWIDLDHGFLIRRREEYIVDAGLTVLYSRTRVPKLLQSGDDWLPAVVETETLSHVPLRDPSKKSIQYPPGLTAADLTVGDGFITLTRPTIELFTISDLITDCKLVEADFDIEWPIGTTVNDAIRQTRSSVTVVDNNQLDILNKARGRRKEAKLLSRPLTSVEKQGQVKSNTASTATQLVVVTATEQDIAVLEGIPKGQRESTAAIGAPK